MSFLYSLLASVLSVLFAITVPFSVLTGQTIKATDPDNIKLCFSALSDTHITESDARDTTLRQAFVDMSKDDSTLDAVVMAGDLTDHGEKAQFDRFFSSVGTSKVPNFIAATGNHDTWCEESPEAGMKYFIDGYNAVTGRSIEKPYYTTVINGYTFITLASEGDHTYATISQEQIDWFDAQMLTASESGLPIFVICHFPINSTNGQAEIWEGGGMGEQSDAVLAVMKKYENVFYITGHLHAGFMGELTEKTKGYSSVESDGSLHYINLPCYMYINTDAGNPLSGCGFVFEVYEDYVLLRARNYVLSDWMPMYDTKIDLV